MQTAYFQIDGLATGHTLCSSVSAGYGAGSAASKNITFRLNKQHVIPGTQYANSKRANKRMAWAGNGLQRTEGDCVILYYIIFYP